MQEFPKFPTFEEIQAKHAEEQAQFFGQFQQTATKVAGRAIGGWVLAMIFLTATSLAGLGGALYIVLRLLRAFNVI